MNNSSIDILELLIRNTWTIFLAVIPTLLTLSTVFYAIESSYRQSYRNAELNMINFTLAANTSDFEKNKNLAIYWMETAVDFKDNGEQRAFSARLLFANLAVSVSLLVILLILYILVKNFFNGAPWQIIQASVILSLSVTIILFVALAFITTFSPGKTTSLLEKTSIIQFEANQNYKIGNIFKNNPWLIKPFIDYMDSIKSNKSYFDLPPVNSEDFKKLLQ